VGWCTVVRHDQAKTVSSVGGLGGAWG
jgi:hypothetical protein